MVKEEQCLVCHGKGEIMVPIDYGSRANRRRAIRNKLPAAKLMPCPKCQTAAFEMAGGVRNVNHSE